MINKRKILEDLVNGVITIDEALEKLNTNRVEAIEDISRYDLLREKRTMIPEVIFCENKDSQQILRIVEKVLQKKRAIILSRLKEEQALFLENKLQEYYELIFGQRKNVCIIKHKNYAIPKKGGKIGIITAGTSDLPVAEEAKMMAEIMGCDVELITDVGVAGIHRLFEPLNELLEKEVDVLIVAAGMEGALPTVVAGLVDLPVIGLPVSVGYGYGGKGQAALMSMLQSCSLGVAVVNIDSGINAGAIAAKIALKAATKRVKEK